MSRTLGLRCSTAVAFFTIINSLQAQGSASRSLPQHIPLRRSSQISDGPGGVNISLPRLPYLPWDQRWWSRLFDAGFKYVRIGQYEDTSDMTGWDWVERSKGQFEIKPEVDNYVNSLVDNGAIVELQLLYGNPIYTSPAGKLPTVITPTPSSVHNRDLGLYSIFWPPTSPDQISAFLRYSRWMLNHFRGRVHYYSLWNEQDGTYWNRDANPEEYGALLKAFVKVVHDTDASAKIVYGGQASLSSEFARRVLDACGCSADIDVFAYHNYPGGYQSNAPPESFDSGTAGNATTIALRKSVTGHAGTRPDIQFWMDEYNSMPSLSPDMNEAIQAKYVPRTLVYNWAQGIPTFIWELINDPSTSEGDNFGIIHGMMFNAADFRPRPVFYTIARANSLFADTHPDSAITVNIERQSPEPESSAPLYTYGFRSAKGKAIVAYWLGARVHPKHPLQPAFVDVTLNGTGIEHPVLIDVDEDKITPLNWDASVPGRLRHVPLGDSVLAIADDSYFDWNVLPEIPSSLSATARRNSVKLHWMHGDEDATSTIVERRGDSAAAWNRVATLPGNNTNFEDTKLTGMQAVSYRVRAGSTTGESGYSNIVTVRLSNQISAKDQTH
jgi:hypothetical protein